MSNAPPGANCTPKIFDVRDIDVARRIIVTAEPGTTTDEHWAIETAWLADRILEQFPLTEREKSAGMAPKPRAEGIRLANGVFGQCRPRRLECAGFLRRHVMDKKMIGFGMLLGLFGAVGAAEAQQSSMSFFVTSTNSGKGANYGGLAGADQHCQALAAAAGAGAKTWRAYLSASASGSSPAVNAKDRIGKGPWQNAKGVVVAKDVAELHGTNNLTKQTALTEKGAMVNGRGDTPNQHDILTGTQPDGTAFAGGDDKTCGNWTKSGDGSAIVGHSDRTGLDTSPPALSWNSSHPSRGCSPDALISTGGNGYLYCFATN